MIAHHTVGDRLSGIIFSGEQYFGTTATPNPAIPEGIVYKLVDPNKYVYKMSEK